jgi:hypothetical protein
MGMIKAVAVKVPVKTRGYVARLRILAEALMEEAFRAALKG